MQALSVVYHRPTGLWNVFGEDGSFLMAFAVERHAIQFARYGQITLEDLK